ncbi:putative phospholipid-transporting atpase [Anaeramoeba ignava]|uniref:Phospholipid-transporting ATPase n=1 Tax=Anaeramoeba ignava TaxID=1746090 RepID=A0A9Q0LB89_ANAIG|nr:putative phospholipid-transporting atpase [Anaeramoeba ignava]|eukprot:Anaeramoba_ignava/a217285_104.p1 GENE.a217285_104~~a217285_104.p1  ORF type:complete len:1143 (+),score=318.73 a217285_104:1-3429(+)
MKCCKKKKAVENRIVYANNLEMNAKFPKNKVTNSKYTILTFLPKNLIEQFSRFMNIYFLMIACLQLWNEITPVNPATTWGPLIIIILLAAIKEGIDDLNRHKADKIANSREYQVIRNGDEVEIKSKDICVGDIVIVEQDEEVPCDLVLLSSNKEDGSCYIQTANLDGETDLKLRIALEETLHLKKPSVCEDFKGVVECAPPNEEIYKFDSRLKMDVDDNKYLSLSVKQLLPQGTLIKNTRFIYGLSVYTGKETKLGRNKRKTPTKWTKLDKSINKTTMFIFSMQFLLFVIFGIVGDVWKSKRGENYEYLDYQTDDEPGYQPIIIPLRFMLLMSLMIPISLKVTLDICKYIYALFINWDLEMWDDKNKIAAKASNTAIIEDLGQIEYIFSDKTGTLTENQMVFKKCSISNTIYGHSTKRASAYEDADLLSAIDNQDENAVNFFRILALCNTVVPIKAKEDQIEYQSSSPDEEALVIAAQKLGFVLQARTGDIVEFAYNDIVERYEVVKVLAFTSERKKMSVLLRNEDTKELILLIKGADDVMIPIMVEGQDFKESIDHLEVFAQCGLRTLCCGYRRVTEEECKDFLETYNMANEVIEKREEALQGVYHMVENNITLSGVTAIEDRLQEEVPDTIKILREAGIKFWMLTGDKYSTAVQIAKFCNLIPPNGKILTVRGSEDKEVGDSIADLLKQIENQKDDDFYVVIEGSSLKIALNYHKHSFLDLSLKASSVICCRTTPQQKSQVVKLVKRIGAMTLAIGDGGNDVAMIQEAHVGIGISGREGLQAARAADFSISRFKFLKRLMLVHGRYAYYRTSFLAQYSFYKSIYFCSIQVLYAFWSGYSGVSFFNSLSVMTYNAIFTSLPIFFFLLDKDVSEESVYLNPHLYQDSQKGIFYNRRTLFWWLMRALYQGVILLGFTVGIYQHYHHHADGSPAGYEFISMSPFTIVIFVQTLTMATETRHFTFWNHFIIWGIMVFYYIITVLFNLVSTSEIYYLVFRTFADPVHWFALLLISTLSIAPVLFTKYYMFNYSPKRSDLIRFREAKYRSQGLSINIVDADQKMFGNKILYSYSSTDFNNKNIFSPFVDCFGKRNFNELNKKDSISQFISKNTLQDVNKVEKETLISSDHPVIDKNGEIELNEMNNN